MTHKIHALLECQKELRTDKNREKFWLEWLKKGVVAECVLKGCYFSRAALYKV